jgi:hypothetical protein
MPFLNAVADVMFGGDHVSGAQYPYGPLQERARGAGFLWDRLVACYAADFRSRGVTLPSLQLSKKGHAPAKLQEELLFPPAYSPNGGAGVPFEAFAHLLLFVSQVAAGATELDPGREGLEAADAALAAAGF